MTRPAGRFGRLDIQTYRERFQPGDHTLVDVREIEEWIMGHIPGAVHIPLDELPERIGEIPTGRPVVVVCAAGIRSLFGAELLLESGYPEVYSLDDGTYGWARRGLPLER